jgi:hypothetical protein
MNDESLDPKRQAMIAALYGELGEEELAKFETLLNQDAALRAEWEELRETRALLETATVNEPVYTPEFVFVDRSRREAKPKRRWAWLPSWSPAWGFASAAACLAILMGAGLRMDHVDNGLVLRFGPGPVPKAPVTTPQDKTPPSQNTRPIETPISTGPGPVLERTAQVVTRDDLNQYSTRMLDALTRLVDDAQDRQRKEFADIMTQFYDVMSNEQQRKYQSLVQRMDGIGLGLRFEQERTSKQISWLTDRMGGSALPDSLATPRTPDKDK